MSTVDLNSLNDEELKKLEIVRLKRQYASLLELTFNPDLPKSRANDAQQSVLQDSQNRIFWITGSNQCLVGSTLVMTKAGPVALKDIKVGDIVYDEKGKEQYVVKTWQNGEKEVADIYVRSKKLASCTSDHKWWVQTYYKNWTKKYVDKKKIKELHPKDAIIINRVKAPLGSVQEPHAYVIGAVLGDGCCLQKSKNFQISSRDELVPNKIAGILDTTAVKLHPRNYNWRINVRDFNYYNDWMKGKYAHEKIVDFDILKTWNRESLLNFVAGLMDTDGSVSCSKDMVSLALGMQSKAAIDAFIYAVAALWQIQLCLTVDGRDKYKNGPIFSAYTRNVHEIRIILEELDKYTVRPEKKWQEKYNYIGGSKSNPENVRAKWGRNKRIEPTYDITVSGENNVYLLANGLITSNSGKSQLAARIMAWWFNGHHPHMTKPASWGSSPLTMILIGRTRTLVDEELWGKKIKPLLPPGTYREVMAGANIAKVVNVTNGNTILLFSHHDAENAREKVQALTANVVWMDEQPGDSRLVSELVMRVMSKDGFLYNTFTPLESDPELRKIVETPGPKIRRVHLSILDNPIYKGREEEAIKMIRAVSSTEIEFRARMYGEWYDGTNKVFSYSRHKNRGELSPTYSIQWPHVAVVDPAASGKAGLTVWAYDIKNDLWYGVLAEYIKGAAAFELVENVERKIGGFNIVLRLTDCNPSGFWKEANSERRKLGYTPINDKAHRKLETIDKVNTAFKNMRLMLTSAMGALEDELVKAVWSERTQGKIVGESRLHLCDTLRYFWDKRPIISETKELHPMSELRVEWHRQRALAAERQEALARKKEARIARRQRQISKHFRRL